MEQRDHEHADLSALGGEIRIAALERIQRERSRYGQPGGGRPRKWFVVIGGVNAILLLVVVIVVLATRGIYDTRAAEVTDAESRFVTTEWRILRELQQRTDRVLREKDREIQLLRQVQQSMRERDATEEEYAQVRLQLQQAYAQREAILQARLSAPQSELETIVSDIEQTTRSEIAEEIAVDPDTPTVETMGAGDSRSLAWYRRVIDDLRVGRTRDALELLEVSGSEASTLLTSDYDRLYSL
ncbi:MAG TPA: hypothetical protein VKA06_05510, partial [Spirochaetia bacterium]|nr:hypothetical protein [Spirochaetia bacterium]